jgi:GH43 family beta-xylosidase
MDEKSASFSPKTYLNPVYAHSFPDPFVLKFCGEYFAYCTGFWPDGNVFGVLHSFDLVTWTELGGAMPPLDHNPPFYWAPEVTYHQGKFYLYYSVGNEELMEIRVAVSESPRGGFVDSGRRLTAEDFAIDPHVFIDDDGKKYLFYAADFLKHTHIGTGTVIDEMIDRYTLAGDPRPVTRAKYDWQVYDPNRQEKGGVRWHTVEGPFVLKRKGIYYEMFSGGNWKNVSYGVSFATADNIERNQEWQQFSDGEKVLPILRTIPDKVEGPGHNSVVRGPNNRELYCIYHRWMENERVLAIDRMDFAGNRIFISGATNTAQIAPFEPNLRNVFGDTSGTKTWQRTGRWTFVDGQAFPAASGDSELICNEQGGSFLCEFSLRAAAAPDENSSLGFRLYGETGKILEFLIRPNKRCIEVVLFSGEREQRQIIKLSHDFVFDAFHLLRIEVDERWVKITLDENIVQFAKLLDKVSTRIGLFSIDTRAAFKGFALTKGFEDLFDRLFAEGGINGWRKINQAGDLRIQDRQLFISTGNETEAGVFKGGFYENYEFVVNIRLVDAQGNDSIYGFLLLRNDGEIVLRLTVRQEGARFYLLTENKSAGFLLPSDFDPGNYHQFRFLKIAGKIVLQLEGTTLGELSTVEEETMVAVVCESGRVALDMVRLTVL